MIENSESIKKLIKFASIEVPPELTKTNFLFLFFNTFSVGMLTSVLAILHINEENNK